VPARNCVASAGQDKCEGVERLTGEPAAYPLARWSLGCHHRRIVPTRSTPTFWGQPAAGDALSWDWAEERLEATLSYWLVSVRADGRPVTRPVWGIWQDDQLLLSVGSTSHWRNLGANPGVTVSLGDAAEVVVVEGRAGVEADPATIERYVEAYNAKYEWNFTIDTAGGTIAISPTTVLAWISGPPDVDAQEAFPLASSRWRF
jgi:Pyridoxamine 5'-phosphate oxidase